MESSRPSCAAKWSDKDHFLVSCPIEQEIRNGNKGVVTMINNETVSDALGRWPLSFLVLNMSGRVDRVGHEQH